jgi:hypothetical protein
VARLLYQPYRRLLWTWFRVLEVDRLQAIEGRMGRLHAASLTAFAYHEPDKLDTERIAIRRELGDRTLVEVHSREALTKAAADMMQAHRARTAHG